MVAAVRRFCFYKYKYADATKTENGSMTAVVLPAHRFRILPNVIDQRPAPFSSACVKSKAACMSFAPASRVLKGANPHRCSISANIELVS